MPLTCAGPTYFADTGLGASETSRVPSALSILSLAPSVINTGAVSLLAAATQRRPPLTTWQTVPSFLMQKPSAERQK